MFERCAVFPGSGAEASFNEQARAFANVFFGEFGLRVPHNDAVIFNAFDGFAAGWVGEGFVGCEGKGYQGAFFNVAQLGVFANVAYPYDFLV